MTTVRGRRVRRRQEDKETTTTGVATTSVRHRVCDYRYYRLEEEERQTMTTGDVTAQGEGSHYDTTTRMTAMTTIMQDRLQERFDKKIRTSLDVIRLLTDGLLLLLAFFHMVAELEQRQKKIQRLQE